MQKAKFLACYVLRAHFAKVQGPLNLSCAQQAFLRMQTRVIALGVHRAHTQAAMHLFVSPVQLVLNAAGEQVRQLDVRQGLLPL